MRGKTRITEKPIPPGLHIPYDLPRMRQFWDKFNKWQNDLNLIREEALPDLKDQVGSQDQQVLEQQVKRLDDLFEWKSSGFPDLVHDLPPP